MTGCSSAPAPTAEPTTPPAQAVINTPTIAAAGLPNPASANCGTKGGRLDIRTDANGGQLGICVFPDGSECEEWALYRNECQPKSPVIAAPTPVVTVLAPIVIIPASTPQPEAPGLPAPAPSPQALPQPEPQVNPIEFQPGKASAMLEDSVAAGSVRRYSVRALAGQTLSINLTAVQGSAVLQVLGGDGTVLLPSQVGITSWSGVLPGTQDYYIDVRSVTNIVTDYWLEVTIPPV
jgi:putative hemolysin